MYPYSLNFDDKPEDIHASGRQPPMRQPVADSFVHGMNSSQRGSYPPAYEPYPPGHNSHGHHPPSHDHKHGHDHNNPPPSHGHYPPGEPPSYIPKRSASPGVYAVNPGAIAGCMNNYTYIWLKNNRSFWMYITFVGRQSVSGYRWGMFGWTYTGLDLRSIEGFSCSRY